MIRALVLLFLLAVGCGQSGPRILSLQEYRHRLVILAREHHPDWKLTERPDQPPLLEHSGGLASSLEAQRGYELYRTGTETLEESLEDQLRALEESVQASRAKPPKSFEEARADLLPGLLWGKPRDGSLFSPLVGDFVEVYFYDQPASTQRIFLPETWARDWQCKPDQIRRAALEGLRRRYPVDPHEIRKGVYRLSDADDFGAARILDSEALRRLADRENDDLVLWAPSRMLAWATAARNQKGIKALQALADKSVQEDPEPLSAQPLRFERKTGRLTLYRP